MGGLKWVVLTVIFTIVAAVIAFLPIIVRVPIKGNIVAEYSAIYEPHTGLLVEDYIYHVDEEGHRMLYRFWEVPLTVKSLDTATYTADGNRMPA